MSYPQDKKQPLGVNAGPDRKGITWTQTELSTHQAWAKLINSEPKAGALMHMLVSLVGHDNAVVASQAVLAKMMGSSTRSIRRWLDVLHERKWIQIVRLRGTVSAYLVNDTVSWHKDRKSLPQISRFRAAVIVDPDEQDQQAEEMEQDKLRRIGMVYPTDVQQPVGEDDDPPTQPALGPDWEVQLPARDADEGLDLLPQPDPSDQSLT